MNHRITKAIIPRPYDEPVRFTEYRYCANIHCMGQQEHTAATREELDHAFRADGWRECLPGEHFCPTHSRRGAQ